MKSKVDGWVTIPRNEALDNQTRNLIAEKVWDRAGGKIIRKTFEKVGKKAGGFAGASLGATLGATLGLGNPVFVAAGVFIGQKFGEELGAVAGAVAGDYINNFIAHNVFGSSEKGFLSQFALSLSGVSWSKFCRSKKGVSNELRTI